MNLGSQFATMINVIQEFHASYVKVQHALRRAQIFIFFGFWGGDIFYNFVVLHVFSKMFPMASHFYLICFGQS
jgi:hypothetical protein